MVRVRPCRLGPTEYKVAVRARLVPRQRAPLEHHPDPQQHAGVLDVVKIRPGSRGDCGEDGATADLDGACVRRRTRYVGRGEETGFQAEQRNWDENSERRKVEPAVK